MLKLRHTALALTLGIGMAAPLSFAAVNSHNDSIVYVMTNASDHNEVVAYVREHDGRTYEAGRYSTDGRGSGGTNDPLQSQGSLTLSPDHHFLFAVNAGSGTVTSFLVGPQGRLLLTDTISAAGSEPLAVVSLQNRVYVLDGAGAGTVVGYAVNDFGRLRALPRASAFLSGTSAGGSSISISPNGRFLVVTERLTNNIDTFPIQYDGSLGPVKVTASPVPGIFSGRFDPAGQFIVSSTGPAGLSNASTISSFSLAGDGSLSAVTQSVPTFGNANCWSPLWEALVRSCSWHSIIGDHGWWACSIRML